MLKYHTLPQLGQTRKRVGRGISAGQGKSAGKGTKGQKARTGNSIPTGFEGGQVRLYMRLAKVKGQPKSRRFHTATVTLAQLERLYSEGERVTLESLRERGLIGPTAEAAKIVGTGTLTKVLKFAGLQFTSAVHALLYPKKSEVKSQKSE